MGLNLFLWLCTGYPAFAVLILMFLFFATKAGSEKNIKVNKQGESQKE